MSDYHDYYENLAFPPQEIKSQDDLNEQRRQSDVLIKAIEKCAKLEKQLKIAVEALITYKNLRYDGTVTGYEYIAKEALAKIKEIK